MYSFLVLDSSALNPSGPSESDSPDSDSSEYETAESESPALSGFFKSFGRSPNFCWVTRNGAGGDGDHVSDFSWRIIREDRSGTPFASGCVASVALVTVNAVPIFIFIFIFFAKEIKVSQSQLPPKWKQQCYRIFLTDHNFLVL